MDQSDSNAWEVQEGSKLTDWDWAGPRSSGSSRSGGGRQGQAWGYLAPGREGAGGLGTEYLADVSERRRNC